MHQKARIHAFGDADHGWNVPRTRGAGAHNWVLSERSFTMPLPWLHTLVASAFFMVVAMVTNIVIRNR